MKPISFKEFAALFRERHKCEPDELRKHLAEQVERYNPDGWFMGEAQLFDSMWFGTRTVLPYGGASTFKSPPDKPYPPRGLASDTSIVIAVMERSEIEQ